MSCLNVKSELKNVAVSVAVATVGSLSAYACLIPTELSVSSSIKNTPGIECRVANDFHVESKNVNKFCCVASIVCSVGGGDDGFYIYVDEGALAIEEGYLKAYENII